MWFWRDGGVRGIGGIVKIEVSFVYGRETQLFSRLFRCLFLGGVFEGFCVSLVFVQYISFMVVFGGFLFGLGESWVLNGKDFLKLSEEFGLDLGGRKLFYVFRQEGDMIGSIFQKGYFGSLGRMCWRQRDSWLSENGFFRTFIL